MKVSFIEMLTAWLITSALGDVAIFRDP